MKVNNSILIVRLKKSGVFEMSNRQVTCFLARQELPFCGQLTRALIYD